MPSGQSWHGRQAGLESRTVTERPGRNPPFVPNCVSMALHPLVGGTLRSGGSSSAQTALIVGCPDWAWQSTLVVPERYSWRSEIAGAACAAARPGMTARALPATRVAG
jgi:hypothetical protein